MTATVTTPKWVWMLLVAAVFGVSSAGVLFQQVDDVPPSVTSIMALTTNLYCSAPLAMIQWKNHGHSEICGFMEKETNFWLLAGGLFLALHFGAWVASLDETSLTHSLLFVTLLIR